VKKGTLTGSPQWWKHLKDYKRVFWKGERRAQDNAIKHEATTPVCLSCGRTTDDVGEHYCGKKHGDYE
jgi:hypothetical protein